MVNRPEFHTHYEYEETQDAQDRLPAVFEFLLNEETRKDEKQCQRTKAHLAA